VGRSFMVLGEALSSTLANERPDMVRPLRARPCGRVACSITNV
jgi:hypothetical protein